MMADTRPAPQGDTWATPWPLFRKLDREFRFTVDAAALPHNAKLPRYWSPVEDGLRQPWDGERVWLNPPYSTIGPWVAKAAQRQADVAVLLLPVRTGTDWWHKHGQHADEVRWFRERVRFEGAAGSPRWDSVLLVFRSAAKEGSR